MNPKPKHQQPASTTPAWRRLVRPVLKWLALVVVVVALLGVAGLWLYLKVSPQTGAVITTEQKTQYAKLENHDAEHFINLSRVDESNPQSKDKTSLDSVEKWRRIWEVITRSAQGVNPPKALGANPVNFSAALGESAASGAIHVTWLGHSSVLASLQGTSLLFDPMFGQYASPIPGYVERFAGSLPPNIEDMPAVDVALISHDHYDHLDYGSIKQYDARIKHYVVPLGVGAHLQRWGVSPHKITELNWWDEVRINNLTVVLTPSKHSSGRTLAGQKSTLWGGFAVLGDKQKLFFSGDTGYGGHFAQIAERLGPFDLALIEDGQYNQLWLENHMLPEQSLQAAVDLKAKQMLPIHWGGFVLSTHPWSEPVKRLIAAKEQRSGELGSDADLPVILTPEIGRTFSVPQSRPQEAWWASIEQPSKPEPLKQPQ